MQFQKMFVKYIKCLFVLSITIGLTACGGGGDAAVNGDENTFIPPVFSGGAGRAVIVGDQLGYGTTLNSDIMSVVPVSSNISGYYLGLAYVETGNNNTKGKVIIPITNWGIPKCFIKSNLIEIRDSSNNVIDSIAESYIVGSNAAFYRKGASSSAYTYSVATNTCLGRGEKGYILSDFGSSSQGNAVSVSINNIESTEMETCNTDSCDIYTFYMPDESWMPESYNIISSNSFMVSVLNTSKDTYKCCQISQYLLLDSNDDPLGWGYLTTDLMSDVPPNVYGQIIDDIYVLDGSSTKIEVFLHYSGY